MAKAPTSIDLNIDMPLEGLATAALDFAGTLIDDRQNEREFDRAVLDKLDPSDADDKALIRRYVENMLTKDELPLKNLTWWQENVWNKIGEALAGKPGD